MRSLLYPLSFLFWVLSSIRNLFYDWGLFKIKDVTAPVLCVGNISAGGTGKTPWVQKISHYFSEQGRKVTIVSRGYSGDFDGVLKVDLEMDPRKCGDEPLWLARNTKASVYVGRNRYKAAFEAEKKQLPDIFILDDGFQHRRLGRRLNFILLDASAPRHHYRLLPVGYLREGFSALKRADVVVLNKCNYSTPENLQWLKEKCAPYVAEDSLFFADFMFSHWEPLVPELQKTSPDGPISMSCGVGNPQAFLETLKEQNIDPVKKFIFPDHYYWKPSDIERMAYNMQREGSRDLMITEKDAVKLNRYKKHFYEIGIQMWVCKMKVSLRENEAELLKILGNSL